MNSGEIRCARCCATCAFCRESESVGGSGMVCINREGFFQVSEYNVCDGWRIASRRGFDEKEFDGLSGKEGR